MAAVSAARPQRSTSRRGVAVSARDGAPRGDAPARVRAVGSDASVGVARLRQVVDAFPRRGYVQEPTPVQAMPRLREHCALHSPSLLVKRDDFLPLLGGGNKTRKLDYVVQDAMDKGCDALVTSGAVQSNHCRLTAAAAAMEGMDCHLVVEERVPNSYAAAAGGNNYLFGLLGVQSIRHVALGETDEAVEALSDRLEALGLAPYVIPGGASNDLGALGYCRMALEIIDEHGLDAFDAIVVCSGSGGTHTGLLTGLRAAGDTTKVIGVSVRGPADAQAAKILAMCHALEDARFRGITDDSEDGSDSGQDGSAGSYLVGPEDVVVVDDYVGPGYSLNTEAQAIAIQLFARRESILLDPVYTGKTAACFLDIARSGEYGAEQKLLFVHTGGAPALYHYKTTATEFTGGRAEMDRVKDPAA